MKYGPCQSCKSDRVGYAYSNLGTHFSFTLDGDVYNGEVPVSLGMGQSQTLRFALCLNCGRIQGKWPLNLTVKDLQKEAKMPDNLIGPSAKTTRKKTTRKRKSKK